jgi:benzaldehyde dehydrogenase (NAD)
MSTERIVADRSVAGELGSKLAERAGSLVVGDPRDQGTMIGPVVNDGARARILELIEDARAKGDYGLAAAVFGEDVDHALEIARRIESGICHVNASTVHDEPQMPFGGVKSSGWGRFGGKAALEEFTELRWLSVQQTPRHYPI